jgi:hypothetical protein
MLIFAGLNLTQQEGPISDCTAIRNCAYSSSAESPAALFLGSVCVFPASNQSTDFPNSRLICRSNGG